MTEEISEDDKPAWQKLEGWELTFAQMWETVFRPELERRSAAGFINDDFSPYMAQLLQPLDGKNRVLLNEEVKGEGLMRPPRDIVKGESVYTDDIAHMLQYELPEEIIDCGHFTIIRAGEGWKMFFNFLSGRAKAKDMLELAEQYLQAAEVNATTSHDGPSVDNLFSASELVSKAELILHRSQAATSKKHIMIASEINAWAKLGNIDAAFVALFNRLSNERPNARYSDRKHRPRAPRPDDFELVRAMIERGLERVARTTDRAEEHERKQQTLAE